MSTMDKKNRTNKTTLWVAIGALVLIILLIAWQGVALFSGDTDVQAITSMLPAI